MVVSSGTYNSNKPDVVVMAVTSQLRPEAAPFEVWIDAWKSPGLLKPSAIKPVLATLEQGLVVRPLGRLQAADQAALRQSISAMLG